MTVSFIKNVTRVAAVLIANYLFGKYRWWSVGRVYLPILPNYLPF